MISTLVLLAQLAGGRPVAATAPGLPPPDCAPGMQAGEVCRWPGAYTARIEGPATGTQITVAVLVTGYPDGIFTSGEVRVRRFRLLFREEVGPEFCHTPSTAFQDTFTLDVDFGRGCAPPPQY